MAASGDSIRAVCDAFDDCALASTDMHHAAAACRDGLIAAYTGRDRHYHDIAHIAAMLALLDEHAPPDIDKLPVRWAILYHDIVYDPRAADNEAASAAAMERDFATLGIDAGLRRRVAELIMATRHGTVAAPPDDAEALLIDIDLAVLASPPAVYDAYASAIRREYAHVPPAAYAAGRARVLEGFLDRPAIFLTPVLAGRWEGAARHNLQREIQALRNG